MVGVVVLSFLICWFPFALMFAGSPFFPILATFFEKQHGSEESVTWLGKFATLYNSFQLVIMFDKFSLL